MNKQVKQSIPTVVNKKKIEVIYTDREPSFLDQRRTSCRTPEYEQLIYREQECCRNCIVQ